MQPLPLARERLHGRSPWAPKRSVWLKRRIGRTAVVVSANGKRLQVVFVSTEVAPWSQVGGLADVAAALPAALAARGHRVMTVAPRYASYTDVWDTGVRVPVQGPATPPPSSPPAPAAAPATGSPNGAPRLQPAAATGSAFGGERGAGEVSAEQSGSGGGATVGGSSRPADDPASTGSEHAPRVPASTPSPQPTAADAPSTLAATAAVPAPPSAGGAADPWPSPRGLPTLAPLSGSGQAAGPSEARFFMTHSSGVDRVFVEHTLFSAADWDDRTSGAVGTYRDGSDHLAASYSVLCQAALAAPLLLWPRAEGDSAPEERSLLERLLQGAPPAAMHDWRWLQARLQHPQMMVNGLAAPLLLSNAPHLVLSRNDLAAALRGGGAVCGATGPVEEAAGLDAEGVVFVGNDWPCGVLPLWLQEYRQLVTQPEEAAAAAAAVEATAASPREQQRQQQQEERLQQRRLQQQLQAQHGREAMQVAPSAGVAGGDGGHAVGPLPEGPPPAAAAAPAAEDDPWAAAQAAVQAWAALSAQASPSPPTGAAPEPGLDAGEAPTAGELPPALLEAQRQLQELLDREAALDAYIRELRSRLEELEEGDGGDPSGAVADADATALSAAAVASAAAPTTALAAVVSGVPEGQRAAAPAALAAQPSRPYPLSATSSPAGGDGGGTSLPPQLQAGIGAPGAFSREELHRFQRWVGRRLGGACVALAVHNAAHEGRLPGGEGELRRLGLPRGVRAALLAPLAGVQAVGRSVRQLASALGGLLFGGPALDADDEAPPPALAPTEAQAAAASAVVELGEGLDDVAISAAVAAALSAGAPGGAPGGGGWSPSVAPPPPPEPSLLRAGVTAADAVVTVSPAYAEELLMGDSRAADPALRAALAAKGVSSVLNGLDTLRWDPSQDALLPRATRYGPASARVGKAAAKDLLQLRLGLERDARAPLVAFLGRLEPQKGADLLLCALPTLMGGARPGAPGAPGARRRSRLQLAMLGSGQPWLERAVEQLATRFPGAAAGVAAFNEPLAHLLLAGADYLLVPSRYEPCGLVALAALRYGTLPIAAATGGLRDIVTPRVGYLLPPLGEPREGGFRAAADALSAGVHAAVAEYGRRPFVAKRTAAMAVEVGWERPAEQWEALLQGLVAGAGGACAAARTGGGSPPGGAPTADGAAEDAGVWLGTEAEDGAAARAEAAAALAPAQAPPTARAEAWRSVRPPSAGTEEQGSGGEEEGGGRSAAAPANGAVAVAVSAVGS